MSLDILEQAKNSLRGQLTSKQNMTKESKQIMKNNCPVCNQNIDSSIEVCPRCDCPIETFASQEDYKDYLEKIVRPRIKEWEERGIEYILINKDTAYEVRRPSATNVETEIIIPAEHKGLPVLSIGDGAFSGCAKITSITIPHSIKRIGCWAFANCTSLANATIPDGVTDIGAYAFENCTKISNIIIPLSVSCLGGFAFSGWTGSQIIDVIGKKDESAALNMGWDNSWLKNSKATIRGMHLD
ncbi:MAG: leucine-rich repeat domain-containing protein [Firmicutes bacterium]|nr:leucine-rich repeat domain-containing protein [Bacillota bacterium]